MTRYRIPRHPLFGRLFRPSAAALLVALGLPGLAAADSNAADWEAMRDDMVAMIETLTLETSDYIGKPRLDAGVIQSMRAAPRHEFVPATMRSNAYANRPLPIGYSQTISQPYIVALMTDLLEPEKDDVILELGTGSGYQAAILSPLVQRVYSIEIVEPLGNLAKTRLRQLGYENVTVKVGDGYYGWKKYAPFDGIVVTAAASHVPPPLIQQLKPGGRIVIPVGGPFYAQYLLVVTKGETGKLTTRQIMPVRFVPLTGGH